MNHGPYSKLIFDLESIHASIFNRFVDIQTMDIQTMDIQKVLGKPQSSSKHSARFSIRHC